MAVDGTYHITINTPMGPQKATLILETKDGTLSGSLDSAMGLAKFAGGTVNGNEATWESKLKTPIGMMKFENTAVVDGTRYRVRQRPQWVHGNSMVRGRAQVPVLRWYLKKIRAGRKRAKGSPTGIDVHHHMLPPDYVKALATVFAALGCALPQWSVEKALRLMDENLIQASVTSISAPGASFGDAKFGRALARQCNECAAKLISNHPLRFGAFATVPLPDVEGTLAEIAYALDTLKFDGVELLTNYKGKYLGDTAFEEVHQELNRRKAVVHVHPGTVPLNPLAPVSDFLMEAPFDTTRTITSLICNGVLERYPDISFIFSHGGGTMPFLATRIGVGSGFMWPGMQEKAPKGFFYYALTTRS